MLPKVNPIFKCNFQIVLLLANSHTDSPSFHSFTGARGGGKLGELYLIYPENLLIGFITILPLSLEARVRELIIYFPHFQVSLSSNLTKNLLYNNINSYLPLKDLLYQNQSKCLTSSAPADF